MFRTIRNRMIASYLSVIILMIGALTFVIARHTRIYHLDVLRREMSEKIDFIWLMIQQEPMRYIAAPSSERQRLIRKIKNIVRLRVTLVNANGTVIADSDYAEVDRMENHRYREEISAALTGTTGTSIRHSHTLNTDMLYVAKHFGGIVFRLAKPLSEVDASIAGVRRYILSAGGILLLLSSIAVVMISRKITKPINETIRFAREFSSGDLSRRIPNYNDDEIGTLQSALNHLAETISEKIRTLDFERHKLENTIESITDGIAVIGRDKRIIIANKAFYLLVGINAKAVGKLFFEAVRSRSLNARIEEAHATGRTLAFSEEFFSGRHCDVSIKPITGPREIEGILIAVHDITEKKKIEQMKTELVGNMSHELKTPVAILKGYIETIERHIDDPQAARELIAKAQANIDRQEALINDILKLNRLESTRDFPKDTVNIIEIIHNCTELLSLKAQKKNVSIQVDAGGISSLTRANRLLAEEVFFNIIDNAISYNIEGGSVEIRLARGANALAVEIADTGIGIPEDSIERIFERFYRVDKSRSRSTGGTGLGLAIVKHAAEILGWRVQASSSDTGSTFTVIIKER